MDAETTLHGKTALVTGASSGIGLETAHALAHEGTDVALLARREDRLRELATEIESEHDVEALAIPTDVTDKEAVADAVETTVDTFGGLDVVVNNAGTGTEVGVPIDEVDLEQYRTVMAVNMDGMFFTTQAAMPHLRETAGVIVFVGSFAGKYPRSGSPVYAGSKWWTRGFAMSLAAEVGTDDIGVSIVNPSEVRTTFADEFRDADTVAENRFEPGEVTAPEDVADAIVFAASQQSPNAVTELDLYRRDKLEML
ncbi:SDR family oxidoreductase [Natronorubrum aibiense]|uniref:SDR family NAD(P)-dependent oxidoreductase n=1 Tax=Natronorubrum aibiense TaxID=348826 RepID=A0A5P9P972_9EURY|nr:SDR family oxidoreductase [Natronorubrum aibiense]QFU84689.1 SDR family NAD(P)-dependent oxidoreductase [Natronorubrum aibiense]